MKEYKMDELFREKLAVRKEIPSDKAWEKLSAELNKNKKKKAMVYWYAAAGIALLLGLGYAFLYQTPVHENHHPMAENEAINQYQENNLSETEIIKEETAVVDANTISSSQDNVEPQLAESVQPIQREEIITNADIIDETPSINLDNKEEEENLAENEIENKGIEELVAQEIEPVEENTTHQMIEEEIKTDEVLAYQGENSITKEDYPEIVITYKKTDTQEKPEKALHKIVKLAKDISEGGYGIGQLREAKNELLAFERKSNKDN